MNSACTYYYNVTQIRKNRCETKIYWAHMTYLYESVLVTMRLAVDFRASLIYILPENRFPDKPRIHDYWE